MYHGGLRPRELGQAPISASVIVSLTLKQLFSKLPEAGLEPRTFRQEGYR